MANLEKKSKSFTLDPTLDPIRYTDKYPFDPVGDFGVNA